MTFDYLNQPDTIDTANAWTPPIPARYTDQDIELAISRFPKTRYYGSERRLLDWIYKLSTAFD